MVCSGSTPTDRSNFPVALKLTYPTPFACEQRRMERVCLVMASHTWMDGARPVNRDTIVGTRQVNVDPTWDVGVQEAALALQ